MRIALALTLLFVISAFAGCMRPDGAEATSTDVPDVTPPTGAVSAPPAVSARFLVSAINITATNDEERTTLYEDDEGATIRYVVSQPADAPRETAFVTYSLNGRIVDVQQLTLEPGEERDYTRTVGDLRNNRTITVEVRAGSAVERAEASVQDWPRAGEDALELGPLTVRADYGLLQQDSRALVNLTLTYGGAEQPFHDFRVKMLCLDEEGTVQKTSSVRVQPPAPGNSTGVDVSVQDCSTTRYGLEFKANGADGERFVGRLLLVPKGWSPPPPQA